MKGVAHFCGIIIKEARPYNSINVMYMLFIHSPLAWPEWNRQAFMPGLQGNLEINDSTSLIRCVSSFLQLDYSSKQCCIGKIHCRPQTYTFQDGFRLINKQKKRHLEKKLEFIDKLLYIKRSTSLEFEEYYKSLGLDTYPFSIYTAEAETEKGDSIYKKPQNYSVIDEGIKGSSIIISGERGTGKTALNLEISRRKNAKEILLVKIEEFSKLEDNYTPERLYEFLTESIAGEFFRSMSLTPGELWGYDKDERIDLSMYFHRYVKSSTKSQLTEQIKKIQNRLLKRVSIGLYNTFRVILNYGLKAAIKISNDALTHHFSALPEFNYGDAEYFKRLEIEVDESFTAADRSFFTLEKLCSLVIKSKISDILVIVDKLDEDPRFKNDSESIGKYLEGIASNNKVMVNDSFKMILFVWSTPFNSIKSNVRTQKLIFQQLSWTSRALKEAAGKRLSAFSDEKLTTIEELFSPNGIEGLYALVEMSNENPRDLWHLINESIKAQYKIDCLSKISSEAIDAGIKYFVHQFNYYEYYPKKAGARADTMDVYSYIKHLMKLDSDSFTKSKLNEMATTGGSTNNYVIAMENMGLIKKSGEKYRQGAVVYIIKDPKIRYARANSIEISN
jgi:hypothetical protein